MKVCGTFDPSSILGGCTNYFMSERQKPFYKLTLAEYYHFSCIWSKLNLKEQKLLRVFAAASPHIGSIESTACQKAGFSQHEFTEARDVLVSYELLHPGLNTSPNNGHSSPPSWRTTIAVIQFVNEQPVHSV
jgi:hypothetical protein